MQARGLNIAAQAVLSLIQVVFGRQRPPQNTQTPCELSSPMSFGVGAIMPVYDEKDWTTHSELHK
jgi:hypothetical protein